MLFLKVTRSVKRFGARFGWLMAELVFVFLGMYGAFLLERMHDDDMDLLRKRQILQALVDEFEDYETELGSASSSLDEAYGVPFLRPMGQGKTLSYTHSLWRDGKRQHWYLGSHATERGY